MKTLNDEWKHYRDSVYLTGINAQQNRELHKSFFAGAMVALISVAEAANIGDGSVNDLAALYKEAESVCGSLAGMAKARN